ncbi:hypothetical protein KX928_03345 [Roseobacter sp. YSTF-M11]|uniref:Aminoglycoside phosphotransferase domain-containing protein n=1 Tax=Roseobacter insulae TaxID=2859783 RepID=A0A9X1JXB9_9RHOB|nr:hypothetical protein [Roseobacter insulae]MBW4706816.1 hypothetical protein [Roseobacter insulae]
MAKPMLPSNRVCGLQSYFEKRAPVALTETSKSWVFLTPDLVFKLKKPVRDDLQDLTPLQARHDNTLMEIDLNRRLAPHLYLGAARVGRMPDGRLVLDDPRAETVDWMVKMRRLPADLMLDACLIADKPPAALSDDIEILISRLGAYYRQAPATRLTAAELMPVQENQIRMTRRVLLNTYFKAHHTRFRRLLDQFETLLPLTLGLLETRVRQGAVVECHGDLRPEHICLTDPPVVYDCLEFSRILRLSDPYSEAVFLGMECAILGADWIGPRLIKGLEAEFGPAPDPDLLRIYKAHHALTRARLSLAHLLVPVPRKPLKWEPLGLRYVEIAEHLVF